MSKIKSLILGSAAVIAASVGAQAADLPVKAKAVAYVKICSLYGAGFYYIPGTDTCIKLGGYTQMDVNFNAGNYDQPGWANSAGTAVAAGSAYGGNNLSMGSRDKEYFTTRARNQFNIDTRTATEYGVVRSFWASNFEFSTGAGPSSGNLTVDYGFVQFAGFTFGKAVGTFQTPWGAYGGNNNTSFLLGGYDNATGITQIAYTWQFGNGVSAQVAVEDNRVISRTAVLNANEVNATLNTTGAVAQSNYTGNMAPEFTGNIKIDQAAFTAQFSAAAHQVTGNYYAPNNGAFGNTAATLVETNGHPNSVWGYALSGGLQLKNLPTGPGDKLSLDVTYANGAMRYLIGGVTGANFNQQGNAPVFAGSYQSMTALTLLDGVYTTGNAIEKTTGWGLRGAFVHNWSPAWETDVFGSYTSINYNDNATVAYCASFNQQGTVKANGYSCNPDFKIWQVGTRTAWTPVQNLTFSAEAMYTMLDQSFTGSQTLAAGAGGPFKPAGVYDFKDQGIVTGNIRVRRTW